MPFDDSIVSVNGADVIRIKPDPGGVQFTLVLDEIIRSQCHAFGIPVASVQTNIRNSQPDGGVDTLVSARIETDPDLRDATST